MILPIYINADVLFQNRKLLLMNSMKKFENLLKSLRYIASLGAYQIAIGNILWLIGCLLD